MAVFTLLPNHPAVVTVESQGRGIDDWFFRFMMQDLDDLLGPRVSMFWIELYDVAFNMAVYIL